MADKDYTQPYSPPKTFDTQQANTRFRIQPLDSSFSIQKAFSEGWFGFKAQMGLIIGVVLITGLVVFSSSFFASFVIGLPAQLVLSILENKIPFEFSIALGFLTGILQNIPAYLVSFPVLAGLSFFGVLILRNIKGIVNSPSIETLFYGYKKFKTTIGIGFLRDFILPYIILLPLVFLLIYAQYSFSIFEKLFENIDSAGSPSIQENAEWAGLIAIAFIIVAIMLTLTIRFAFAYHLALDHNTGVIESLKLSWRMTASVAVTMKLVAAFFLFSILMVLSLLMCLVPFIFTAGLILTTISSIYEQLLPRILLGEY